MVQGNYKVLERIELAYHSAGDVTGLTCVALVYDETHTTHVAETSQLISSLKIGGEKDGVYIGGFTPDVEGTWTIVIEDGAGGGNAVKTFLVGGHNIDEVGDDVETCGSEITTLGTEVTTLGSEVTTLGSEVTTLGAAITTVDAAVDTNTAHLTGQNAALTTLDGYVSTGASSAAVAAIASPAAIS